MELAIATYVVHILLLLVTADQNNGIAGRDGIVIGLWTTATAAAAYGKLPLSTVVVHSYFPQAVLAVLVTLCYVILDVIRDRTRMMLGW